MNDEIMSIRLMAACAQAEVVDALNGEGDVEQAKKSLALLCCIIADAYPSESQENIEKSNG